MVACCMPHYKHGSVILHVLLRVDKHWHLAHDINVPQATFTVLANVAVCLHESVFHLTGMASSRQKSLVTWYNSLCTGL